MAINWFNLGKTRRSKFGRWLDNEGITQSELRDKSKLSQGTISKLCNDSDYRPKLSTIARVKKALKALGYEPPNDNHFGM